MEKDIEYKLRLLLLDLKNIKFLLLNVYSGFWELPFNDYTHLVE